MIHRTFRSLDQPPKLVGFTVRQWLALIGGAAALLAVVHALALPAKAAITLGVFTLGLPAALAYVSETGGLRVGSTLWDAVCWRLGTKLLAADGHTVAAGTVESGQDPLGSAT
jgi:hypothetical protein